MAKKTKGNIKQPSAESQQLNDQQFEVLFKEVNAKLAKLGHHDLQLSQIGLTTKLNILGDCRLVRSCSSVPGPNGTSIQVCTEMLDCS